MDNYGRFYIALKGLETGKGTDREELKRSIVLQYTSGRTDSLKEMTREEYTRCCQSLESHVTDIAARRKKRSEALKLMQEIGIDTRDWDRINAFCCDSRIAGVPFAALDMEELTELSRKLRAVIRKGGVKNGYPLHPVKEQITTIHIPDNGRHNQYQA